MKWGEVFGWSRTAAWFIILVGLFWLLWCAASGAVPEQMRLSFLARSVVWLAVIGVAAELYQWFWYAQMLRRKAARPEEDAVVGWSMVLCLVLVLGFYYYTGVEVRAGAPAPFNAESHYLNLLFPLALVSIFAPWIAVTLLPASSRLRIAQRVAQVALVVMVLWPTYHVSVYLRTDATRARLSEAAAWMHGGKPERALVACVQARFLTPWHMLVWHCLDNIARERGWETAGQHRLP